MWSQKGVFSAVYGFTAVWAVIICVIICSSDVKAVVKTFQKVIRMPVCSGNPTLDVSWGETPVEAVCVEVA
jgi:hypothetical protein